GNRSGHDDPDAPAEAQQTDDKHHAEGNEELEHELIDSLGNVDRLVSDLAQGDAERQTAGNRLGFRLKCLAEVQTVPPLLHDYAQRKSGLALVADHEGGRILMAAAHFGDIGELEVAPARYDWDVGDLLEIVIGAIKTHKHLRPLGIDRARRRAGVLVSQRSEDVLRRDAEGDTPWIGELDEDPLRAFAQDVDLLHAGNVQQFLPDRFGPPDEQAPRHPRRLQGIERKSDVGILIVDK